MTQLIAQLKQIAIGDGVQPSHVFVFARVLVAFSVGLIIAAMLF